MESPPDHEGTLMAVAQLPPRGRVRAATAVLAGVAGFSDAIGFLTLFGIFTAHQSGNTTHFGVSVGTADWTDAAVRFFPIPMFVVAIALGTVIVEVLRRRASVQGERLGPLVLAEAALLACFAVVGTWAIESDRLEPAGLWFFVLAALLAAAMGIQTAVLRRVGRLNVHTTFISGMLTQVAVGTVTWMFDRRDGNPRGSDPDGPVAHAVLALGVWLCFATGAVAGALLHDRRELWAMLVPVLVLVAMAVYERVAGLAEHRG